MTQAIFSKPDEYDLSIESKKSLEPEIIGDITDVHIGGSARNYQACF